MYRITPMNQEELLGRLSRMTPRSVTLRINENRSTFLSLQKSTRKELKLSLHKVFLHAQDEVLEAVMLYTLKRDKEALTLLRHFTNLHLKEVDSSDRIKREKLITKGRVYDLSQVYRKINYHYFEGKLDLHITWFQRPKYRRFSSLTYGSYSPSLKLVRINNLLDHEEVPLYFVEYVVYHEMLHHVCDAHVDRAGRRWVHTKEFREREKLFEQYTLAMQWEKKAPAIFKKLIQGSYGRT